MIVVQFQQVIQSRHKWIITIYRVKVFLQYSQMVFVCRLTTICTVARHTVHLRVSPSRIFYKPAVDKACRLPP